MTHQQQRALFTAAAEAVSYFAEQLARNPALTRASRLHGQLSQALAYRVRLKTDKVCLRCGLTCPMAAYAKRAGTKDGRQTWCRRCVATYQRAEREARAS